MIKKYTVFLLFLFVMITGTVSAQSAKHSSEENPSESLSIYPNPATGGKVFLNSKSSELKETFCLQSLHNFLTKRCATDRFKVSAIK